MSDPKLLSRLFISHAKQVKRFLRQRIGRASDAPDLSQEVFLRLLRLQDLGAINDPQGYLFTVAANLAKERAYGEGRQAREARLPIDEVLEAPELAVESPVEGELDTAALIVRLRAALQQLPPRDREILAMVYEERLSYREIARRWGVSKSAVEKALALATARCRKHMEVEEAP